MYHLQEATSFLLSRTYSRLKNLFAKRLKAYGITPEQWVLLVQIEEQEGVSPSELAAHSLRDKPYTTRLLDKMVEQGLLHKVENREDRRSALVFLTAEGRRVKAALLPVADAVNDCLQQGMNPDEVVLLKRLLQQMHQNLLAAEQKEPCVAE